MRQTTLTMGSVSATITWPAEGPAGSEINVTWAGPNATLDYLSVDPEGAAPNEYGVSSAA